MTGQDSSAPSRIDPIIRRLHASVCETPDDVISTSESTYQLDTLDRLVGLAEAKISSLQKEIESRSEDFPRSDPFRDLFEHAPAIAYVVDSDGRFLFVNGEWRKILGYSGKEAASLSSLNILPSESLAHCEEVFAKTLAGNAPERFETTFVSKMGKRFEVEGALALSANADGAKVISGVFHDISARNSRQRELEESASANEAFLRTMSHELRAPLHSILGLSESLQEKVYGPLSDKQRKLLRLINGSGYRLLDTIGLVLDLTTIESEGLRLQRELTDLDSLCSSTIRRWESEARTPELRIHYGRTSPTIEAHCDPRRVAQILSCLLTDSAKRVPAHSALRIELGMDDAHAEIAVIHTGGPLSPAVVSAMNLSEGTRATRRQGFGSLELSMVIGLVQLHGGQIVATSTPDETRITCRLPDAQLDE